MRTSGRKQLRGVGLVARQADLLQGDGGRATQVARDRVDALLQGVLPGGQAGDQGATELRNHEPREGVHLLRQPAHRRVRVGVTEAEDAQLRLAVRELLQRR